MSNSNTFYVAQYTDMPLGRNSDDGPRNGEDYRENIIVPALREYDEIVIDFEGTLGTAPSFLEELFGGLIRHRHLTMDELHRRIKVKSKYQSVMRNIEGYISAADAELKKSGS